MLGKFDPIDRAERGLVLVTVLLAALLAVGLRPAPVQAAMTPALGWPESRQPIQVASEVMLGQFLDGIPGEIPCQAYVAATVVSDGSSTDSVSAQEPAGWYECGSLTVTDGFTSVALNEQEVQATAEPEITLDEPGGCVYGLARVEGHEAYEGRFALYAVAGSATLKSGPSCASTLEVKGSLGLYGPEASGFGIVPWVEVGEQESEAAAKAKQEREEREAAERAKHEREERVAAEKQRHEHEEEEARERAEKQRQHEREGEELREKQAILASLSKVFPTGRPVMLAGPLKTDTWSASFDASTAGKLVVSWYQVAEDARLSAQPDPVLVATGSETFMGSETKKITIRLTRKGKHLLERARALKLTARASFASRGGMVVVSVHTFALKR